MESRERAREREREREKERSGKEREGDREGDRGGDRETCIRNDIHNGGPGREVVPFTLCPKHMR